MKVAIYSRKSTFTGKGDSVENQIQMCKDYMQNLRNRSNEKYEFLIYEDEGFSGGNTNRPQFKKLLKDIKEKKFKILICYRLDRISRNVSDFSNILETLQMYDIDFISIKEEFDTSTPMGRAMIYIASVFAQFERETIAERVRDNMIELAKSGRWLGGTPPLGYDSKTVKYMDENLNERSLTKLSENQEELNLVKLIFDKYLELKSLSNLEAYMLANYYKTRRGSNFDKTSLKRILTNTVYVKSSDEIFSYLAEQNITVVGTPDNVHGILTYNKLKSNYTRDGNFSRSFRDTKDWIAAVGKHKGIIEPKDWLMVQNIREINKDKFVVSSRSHNALLTGIIRCKKCGSKLRIVHGVVSKKTGKRLFYYTCSLKKDSKGARCNNKNGKVELIDNIVVNAIKELGENKLNLINELENQLKNKSKKFHEANEKENIDHLIEQKKKQVDNLLDKISLDPDLSDLIIPKLKDLKNELKELTDSSLKHKDDLNNLKAEEVNLSFIKSLLNKCSLIDSLEHDEIRELIRGLTEEIRWDGETKDLEIDTVGSRDSKKRRELMEPVDEKILCLSDSGTRCRQSYASCFK
ncbi:recombinase family protein [Clostridium botulinum]|uniref:recombinase family protein n=1 Tax=Clostridium botulinum TaxID=1491 RepID=UPI0009B39D83|nr:recombinase family protein [Clostridium botulinum]